MQFHALRTHHPRFIFQEYLWKIEDNDLIIQFHFQVDEHHFAPTLTLPAIPTSSLSWLASDEAANYLLNLGMIEAISYWKATCSPMFELRAGYLSTEQLAWWHELYLNGLGEFWYHNQIDFTQPDLLTFICTAQQSSESSLPLAAHSLTTSVSGDVLAAAVANTTLTSNELENNHTLPRTRFLVGVGGGKDSAVTLGLLDQLNQHYNQRFAYGALLLTPQSPAADRVVAHSQATQVLHVHRTLDPHLLELNQQGYLNGHTPFSAYFAFMSVLAARIYGFDTVVVSNEQSANEGNLEWHGRTINHQYSKTYQFETLFRTYLETYFGQQPIRPNYFSILRPFNELQIAQAFSQFPAFWPIFRSCNIGQKTDTWCHHCPKCVFVYTVLACFLNESVLVGQIFERNLLDDISLLPIVEQLIGYEANKPFECVGSRLEVLAALKHISSQYQSAGRALPTVLAIVQEKLGTQLAAAPELDALLTSWTSEHHLPTDLEFPLKELLKIQSTP